MVAITTEVSGPLFKLGGTPVNKAIRDTVQDVTERGS